MTTTADGTFEVVESWKGDLPVGEQLVIPELRPTANAIPIFRSKTSWPEVVRSGSEQIPREPVGSRMILFLKSSEEEQTPSNRMDEPQRRGWKPSNFMGSMKASVVWIDGDRMYCFEQLINPGPSVLSESSISEEKLRNRVAEINRIQEQMTAAVAAENGQERAERLKPYVHSDIRLARQFALEELGKSGPAAAGTIREMLDDPAFSDEASELVIALVKAGGEAVGEELNRRLQQDLAFWRSTGPSLSEGWWNEDPRPQAPLRNRCAQTYQLILGIEQTHCQAVLNTAMQLRDFWRSLPQLNDPSGLNQIAEECDKLIGQLQANATTDRRGP